MSPTPLRNKTRKRAVSMAGGFGREKQKAILSPKSKRRSLGPPKGILKSRMNNVEDSMAPSLSADMTAYNIQQALEPVNFESDTIRKTLPATSRRVSFAATASVRTIRDLREGNTNSTESPSSPTASDYDNSMDRSQSEHTQQSADARTVSNDTEQSMEIEETSTESYDGDSMDATSMFGDGIVDGRRSSIPSFRPRARSSLAPRDSANGSARGPRDSSHPVGEPLRPPKPPSKALLDLQSVVSSSFPQDSDNGEAEMELDEAVHRLSAVWNSNSQEGAGDDTFSSISEDSIQQSDQTMDLTKIGLASFSRGENITQQRNVEILTAQSTIQEADMSISDTIFQSADQSRILDASLSMPNAVCGDDLDGTLNSTIVEKDALPHTAADSQRSQTPDHHGLEKLVFRPTYPGLAQSRVTEESQSNSGGLHGPPSHHLSPSKAESSYMKPTRSTAIKTSTQVLKKATSAPVSAKMGDPTVAISNIPQMKSRNSLPSFTSTTSVRRPSGYSRTRQSLTIRAIPQPEDNLTSQVAQGESITTSPVEFSATQGNIISQAEHGSSSPSRARRVRRSSKPETPRLELFEAPRESAPMPIGLEEFHIMTGVKFMDEIACPRKSAVRPSLTGTRRDSLQGSQKANGNADYFVAINATVPQLHMYSWVANEMRKWIDESKETYLKAEEEVARVTPMLFLEYAEADEEARQDYTSFFKLVKACEQLRAKSKWYQWKRGWVVQMYERSLKARDDLEDDSNLLQLSREKLKPLLPLLRERNKVVLQELENEKLVIDEIESGNLQQLEELKDTISEQNGILEEYYTKVAEARSTLDSLQERLSEMTSQHTAVRRDIDAFQGRITLQTGSTCSGVLRIKDDLEWIQNLHRFQIQAVDRHMLRFAFGDQFDVAIVCGEQSTQVESVEILARPQRQHIHDCLSKFSEYMIRVGYHAISRLRHAHLQTNIQRLVQIWTSMGQIYSQLAFLAAQWPVTLNLESVDGMHAEIQVLFRSAKAKACISFHFDHEVLIQWPMSLRQLRFDAQIIYGELDSSLLSQAIQERLTEASPADSHACLQDACCAALAKYQ